MPRHIVSLMPRYVLCGLILSAGLLDLAGCGSYNAPSQPPAAPTSVTISPTSASVPAGSGTQNFTATVMNDYLSRGVTWALSGAGCSGAACGSLSNMTSSAVTYNAPTSVPNPATVTLTATSVNDTSKSSTATITVTAAAAPGAAVTVIVAVELFEVSLTERCSILGTQICWAAKDQLGLR